MLAKGKVMSLSVDGESFCCLGDEESSMIVNRTQDAVRDFTKKRIEPDLKNGGKEWE